jgi:16S rRNA C1402 N4-methylase RsmH
MEGLKRDSETKIEAVIHKPVMLAKCSPFWRGKEALTPGPRLYLGRGRHAQAILGTSPALSYIGIDADPEAIQRSARRLSAFSEQTQPEGSFFDRYWRIFRPP